MSVIYVVLPLALLIALAAFLAFAWAARSGQLDDLTTPGVRMLLDDDDSDVRKDADEPEDPARPRRE